MDTTDSMAIKQTDHQETSTESHLLELEDLDPSLELTLDLQSLIDKAHDHTEVGTDQLFPELAHVPSEDGNLKKTPASCSDLVEETNLLDSFVCPDLNSESYVDLEEVKPIRGRPKSSTKAVSSKANKRRRLTRDSEDYRERRERNNIAVRKSREKARLKQRETADKVKILSDKNEELQKKVDLLTKELAVLKGLFSNIGAPLPSNLCE